MKQLNWVVRPKVWRFSNLIHFWDAGQKIIFSVNITSVFSTMWFFMFYSKNGDKEVILKPICFKMWTLHARLSYHYINRKIFQYLCDTFCTCKSSKVKNFKIKIVWKLSEQNGEHTKDKRDESCYLILPEVEGQREDEASVADEDAAGQIAAAELEEISSISFGTKLWAKLNHCQI
jgi:hypothetical protein